MKKIIAFLIFLSGCAFPVEEEYISDEKINDNSTGIEALVAILIPQNKTSFNILEFGENVRNEH